MDPIKITANKIVEFVDYTSDDPDSRENDSWLEGFWMQERFRILKQGTDRIMMASIRAVSPGKPSKPINVILTGRCYVSAKFSCVHYIQRNDPLQFS